MAGRLADAALWPLPRFAVKAACARESAWPKRAMAKDSEREQRLAEALRENLRRRKAQQRGASETERTGGDTSPPRQESQDC